jgi:hypothetical protein
MTYTYSTLCDDIVANMEEDSAEFLVELPSIISRAQNYLQRRVDPINIIRYTTVSVSAATRTLDLPTDLLILRSVQVCATSGWNTILQQTNEYLTAYWPDYTSCAAVKYYAPKDNTQIFLAPTPINNETAILEYVPRVTVLSTASPTNWFSDFADAAFFSACMMYANLWTKNSAASQLWKASVDEELATLNNEGRRTRKADTVDRGAGTPENTISGQI